MKTAFIEAYNVDRGLVELWETCGLGQLLPIQEAAVKKYNLFGEGNLLIFSPTSSGKTFIGEMAALHTARRNQRVLYLVPQKALAEEKFEEFRRRYKKMKIKVVISTRDRKEYDRQINAGKYHVAVVVFEKMQSLLVANPSLLRNVGLVLVDELQMIGDPKRGPSLEVLLTKILTSSGSPRIMGLSAVLGKARSLASWLNAQLCVSYSRPMELRKGVLCDGVFKYVEHNSKTEGEEQFTAPDDDANEEGIIMEQVRSFVEDGEQCLVFRKSRVESVNMARGIGTSISGSASTGAIAELDGLEDSNNKDMLMKMLSKGVAYHNSDLDWEQRDVIERNFRKGDIRVLVSTSTLAMGMNLPVKNVFIDADRWDRDTYGKWTRVPISVAEYENMAGRAGRLGLEKEFGRAILVSDGDFQAKTLFDVFVNGKLGDIEPTLDSDPIEHHVLNFVASGLCGTREEIRIILLSSFTGKMRWSGDGKREAFETKLNDGINHCIEGELITESSKGKLSATELGRAIAVKGVRVDTGIYLAKKIKSLMPAVDTVDIFDILIWLNACPEGKEIYFNLSTAEHRSGDFLALFKRTIKTLSPEAYKRYSDIESKTNASYDLTMIMKKTLLLYDWVRGVKTVEMEDRFQCYTGTIANLGREFAWLAETLTAIAKVLGWPDDKVKMLADLSGQLIHGITAEALQIAGLRVRGLARGRLQALAKAGFNSYQKIFEAPVQDIEKLVTKKFALNLLTQIRTAMSEEPEILQPAVPEAPAIEETEPDVSVYHEEDGRLGIAYLSNAKIRLDGRKRNKRCLAEIDGDQVWMREQTFCTLTRLAVAAVSGGIGWVKGPALGTYDTYHQIIRRLKEDLKDHQPDRLIENDKETNYRLSVPPKNITLDVAMICRHMRESGLPQLLIDYGLLDEMPQDEPVYPEARALA